MLLPRAVHCIPAERRRDNVKKAALFILVAALTLAALVLVVTRQGGMRTKPVQAGDPAPDFRMPTLDGREVTLASLRGRVVMLHFWATWCPPCVEELPTVERLHRSLKGRDFELLAVSVDDNAGVVREFLQKSGISVPVVMDTDRAVADRYGTFRFPETYLIDRNGIMRRRIIGAQDWTTPQAIAMVSDLLDKQ